MAFPAHEETDLERITQLELTSGERSSFRFPLRLPVIVLAEGQKYTAETENFSSGGVLLRLSTPLTANTAIAFLIEVPAGFLGAVTTAAIQGEGRVIRSYTENGRHYSAIVIHEYRFQ